MIRYCNCAVGQILEYFKVTCVEELYHLNKYKPDIHCVACKGTGILSGNEETTSCK